MSKGSAPRPLSVSQEEYSKNFDRIFKKQLPDEPELPKNNLAFTNKEFLDDMDNFSINIDN